MTWLSCATRHRPNRSRPGCAQWLAPGAGLQRGQDAHRHPGRKASTSWGSPSADPRQAADQTDQGGRQRIRNGCAPKCGPCAGPTSPAVLARLNPIVRGWSAYYRTVVSSEMFTALDHYLWKLTYKWAKHDSPEQAEAAGSSTGTSAGSTSPGRTGGCSATATAAPTSPGSPGRRSSGTRWSGTIVTRRPGLGRVLGRPAAESDSPPRSTGHPASAPVTARSCPLCGLLLPRRPPAAKPRTNGSSGYGGRQGVTKTPSPSGEPRQ